MSGRNRGNICWCLSIGAILIMGSLASTVHSTENPLPRKVVVKKGETLSSIVIRETGRTDPNLWMLVAKFNNRTVDQTLEIGDELLLPVDLVTPQVSLDANPKTQPGSADDSIEVGESDTTASRFTESQKPGNTVDKPASRSSTPQVTLEELIVIENEPSIDIRQAGDSEPPVANSSFNQGLTLEEIRPTAVPDEQPIQEVACNGQEACLDEQSTIREEIVNTEARTISKPVPDTAAPLDTMSVDSQQEPSVSYDATLNVESSNDIDEKEPVDSSQKQPAPDKQKVEAADKADTAGKQDNTTPEKSAQAATETRAKPGLFEVDEESAVRALERSLIQLNALLLKPGRAEATASFDYSFNANAELVLVSVEDSATNTTVEQIGQLESEVENTTVTLDLKLGLPFDSQISLSLPFNFIDQETSVFVPGTQASDQGLTSNGREDYSITIDKTLAVESGIRPDIIASVTYNSDTGADGFGSNAEESTIGIRLTKRQDPLVFTAGVSQTFSQNTGDGVKAGDVTQFTIGTLLAASPYTSLQFIFSQALVADAELNGLSIPDTDGNIASFAAGASSVLGQNLFLNAQLSIGLVDKASDYRVSFALAKQFSL